MSKDMETLADPALPAQQKRQDCPLVATVGGSELNGERKKKISFKSFLFILVKYIYLNPSFCRKDFWEKVFTETNASKSNCKQMKLIFDT